MTLLVDHAGLTPALDGNAATDYLLVQLLSIEHYATFKRYCAEGHAT